MCQPILTLSLSSHILDCGQAESPLNFAPAFFQLPFLPKGATPGHARKTASQAFAESGDPPVLTSGSGWSFWGPTATIPGRCWSPAKAASFYVSCCKGCKVKVLEGGTKDTKKRMRYQGPATCPCRLQKKQRLCLALSETHTHKYAACELAGSDPAPCTSRRDLRIAKAAPGRNVVRLKGFIGLSGLSNLAVAGE